VCRGGGVCVFITAVPNTKLCAWGEEDSGGNVLWDTTSRGLCGLGWPPHTSERPCIALNIPSSSLNILSSISSDGVVRCQLQPAGQEGVYSMHRQWTRWTLRATARYRGGGGGGGVAGGERHSEKRQMRWTLCKRGRKVKAKEELNMRIFQSGHSRIPVQVCCTKLIYICILFNMVMNIFLWTGKSLRTINL